MLRVNSSGGLSRIRSNYDGSIGEWEDTDTVMRAGRVRRTGVSTMATHIRSECIRRYGPYNTPVSTDPMVQPFVRRTA